MPNNADNFTNPISVATGGTGTASLTAYTPLAGGTTSTGVIQQAATGFSTSGNILRSRGASALPIWAPFSSWVLLSSQNVTTAASVVFDNTVITSAYTLYYVDFWNLTSSGSTLDMNISTNNGSTYITTGYQSGYLQNVSNSATDSVTTSTTAAILQAGGLAPTNFVNGRFFLSIPPSATFAYMGTGDVSNSSAYVFFRMYGNNSSTTTVNNIKMFPNSGTITGNFRLYGIKQ